MSFPAQLFPPLPPPKFLSSVSMAPWHQVSGVEFDRAGVAAHAKNLANKVKGGLEGSLKTLGVEVVDATGELADANTVKAVETGKTFTAKDIILAPGSLPFVPPGVQVMAGVYIF